MKTIRKQVLLICMLVLAAISVSLFVACKGNKPQPEETLITYSVLVQDENSDPVKGVSLYWSKGTTRYDAVTTGDDGKATMELAADTYTVSFVASTIPDGYTTPDSVEVTKDNYAVTVALTKDFRYVVKLVNEDGTLFYYENVMVAICEVDGNCLTPAPINTDGTWYMSGVTPGDYKVQIALPADIAEQYTFEGNTASSHYYTGEHFSATVTEMTIVMKEVSVEKTAYTVTVLKPDETPATGVYVTLDKGTTGYAPAKTDEDGKAVIEVPAYGVYNIVVTAPEGFTFDTGLYKTTEANKEVTVKLSTLNTIDFEDEMTEEEEQAFGNGFNQFGMCPLAAKYSFKYTFAAGETKYFTFTAYKASEYIIYSKTADAVFTICTSGTDYSNGEKFTVSSTLAQAVSATKGKQIYFSVKAAAAGELQIVIAGPDKTDDSSVITMTDEGTEEITVVTAAKYATIYFAPTRTGVYEIRSEGDYDTRVEYFASSFTMIKTGENDDASATDKNFCYGDFEIIQVGPTLVFRVYVKDGEEFPAVFNVKITRTGDAQELVVRETQTVTPAQLGDTAYEEIAGSYVDIDLTVAQTIVKGSDGYYHVGTATGPVLVAKLSASFRNFGIFSTQSGGKAALDYYVAFADYQSETIFWDYISFLEAYTAKCNSDGVYPVNDELKLMLERWAGRYINEYTFGIEVLGTIAKGNEWLIPCGYYQISELSGSGTSENPYIFDIGSYEITLPADEPVYISMYFGEFTVTVMTDNDIEFNTYRLFDVEEIDGGYKFNCETTKSSRAYFTVKNNESNDITLIFKVTEKQVSAGENETELVLGQNTVYISADDWLSGVSYTFTPDKDGRYVISSVSEESYLMYDKGSVYEGDGMEMGFAVTVDAQAGETYSILLSSMDEDVSYNVVVNKELDVGENEVEITESAGTIFGFNPVNSGKYLIYAYNADDPNACILWNNFCNGYSGDGADEMFAFVGDYESFTDYYFCFAGTSWFDSDYPVNYSVYICKLDDASISLGENTVTGTYDGNVYAFTPEEDGTYKIFSSNADAALLSGFDFESNDMLPPVDITIEDAQAGKTYFFVFSISSWDDELTYDVSVTKVEEIEVNVADKGGDYPYEYIIYKAEASGNYLIWSDDALAIMLGTDQNDLREIQSDEWLNHVFEEMYLGNGDGFEYEVYLEAGEYYLIKIGSYDDEERSYTVTIEFIGGESEGSSYDPLNMGYTPVTNGNTYTFTASADGTYVISAPESSFYMVEGETGFTNSKEFELAEGDEVTITVYFTGMVNVTLKTED